MLRLVVKRVGGRIGRSGKMSKTWHSRRLLVCEMRIFPLHGNDRCMCRWNKYDDSLNVQEEFSAVCLQRAWSPGGNCVQLT